MLSGKQKQMKALRQQQKDIYEQEADRCGKDDEFARFSIMVG
jgi:hypothetical protein